MSVVEIPQPTRLQLALVELTNCVCEQLKVNGAGETCWCGLYAGALVAWDYCAGECGNNVCGMGYVRLAAAFPSEIFPAPVVDLRCRKPLAWQIEVGALRCVPQMPDGSPLDTVSMSEVALNQALDAQALWLAMQCCGLDVAAEIYTPVGPDGTCVGGFWTGYLALD